MEHHGMTSPRRSFHCLGFCTLLPAVLLLCPTADIHARNDGPPVDATATLAELAKLESAYRQSMEQQREQATAALRQAAGNPGSAGRFYEEAVEASGAPDFSDWKKKNADLLRDKNFQEAVQMHLRYLLLSLERGSSDEPARWAEPSLQYARELARLQVEKDHRQGPGQARDILNRPLTESPFVRWQRLGALLPRGDSWELVPGNLAGILEKNVRQPWRQSGDARVDTAWQIELETGAALATDAGSDRAAEDFNTRIAPPLLFRRARDRAATGQPNRAAADILDLARQHPGHPEFPQWAATLREMLQTPASPQESAASPSGDF